MTEWEKRQRLSNAVDELNDATARWNCNIANGLQGRNQRVGHLIRALEREIRELREGLGIPT